MIEFMSSWVKGLGLAIVIVSILEMLLPNNKTKKYIRMVMGIYILFTIVSPFISNRKDFNINDINLEEYTTTETSTRVDQSSMNERIQELYIEELEKDITKKLKEKGYQVTSCKVKAEISDNEEETKIKKIKPVDTSIKEENKKKENTEINKSDIQNIKKFLIEEYGVNEKCLVIN